VFAQDWRRPARFPDPGRAELADGPVFAQDWRRLARFPDPGRAEADLSVQLSGWMVLEAAAAVQRAG
jgi:predicted alpha-1,6-mannanase (GH76 family)